MSSIGNDTPTKIALTGISGSGKDFFGEHIINNYGFTRFSFSDQLKNLATTIYPWLDRDYPAIEKEKPLNMVLPTGEKIDKSPREIWLHLNKLRDIEDKLFIRMLNEEIKIFYQDKPNRQASVLVTDIRSNDEFNWCIENGFVVIHIQPNKKIYKSYEIDKYVFANKDRCDYVFENQFDGVEIFDSFFKNIVMNK